MIEKDFSLTIVVPTKGRQTLENTVISLYSQDDPDWKAIVVCDGFDPPEWLKADNRISAIRCNKVGVCNHAGAVRNYGIKFVTTKWIGFVDDDDILTADYVSKLKRYNELDGYDIIIFTMEQDGKSIPARWNDDIIQNDVGISYAYKTYLSHKHNFYFRPSSCEDYDHVKRMSLVAKYMIDRSISYIVRPKLL